MNSKMAITTYLSTITLNAHGLNGPIRRPMEAEWITKQDTYITQGSAQVTPFLLQNLLLQNHKHVIL